MRTTSQLLLSVDSALDSHLFALGLCDLIRAMYQHNLLNREELDRLDDYLYYHTPKGRIPTQYWWPIGEKRPRRKWLRKRIRIERIKDTLKSIGLWQR